jgi:hypothetical protein
MFKGIDHFTSRRVRFPQIQKFYFTRNKHQIIIYMYKWEGRGEGAVAEIVYKFYKKISFGKLQGQIIYLHLFILVCIFRDN